jgi:anti-anti-sigma regulatory factor
VRARGGVLRLSGARGTVKDTLEIAGFCALFPVYDSMEAALEPR